jgi:hypothetical protein
MSQQSSTLNIKMGLAMDANGQFVDISDVQSGKQSDCYCISCKTPLIARKGEINRHHFAHANESVTDCNWSPETELHEQTKRYFLGANTIIVPIGIESPIQEKLSFINPVSELAVLDSTYTADVVITVDSEPVYIEVKVTHETTREKARYYKTMRTNALEIDMAHFLDYSQSISLHAIADYLEKNVSIYKWLSINPVGLIGHMFHQQYYQNMVKVKEICTSAQDKLIALKASKTNLENKFKALQNKYHSLNANELIQKERKLQEDAYKQAADIQYKQEALTRQKVSLDRKSAVIDRRLQDIDQELNQYKRAGQARIDDELRHEKAKASAKWEEDFIQEHAKLVSGAKQKLDELKLKHKLVSDETINMQSTLESLDERERNVAIAKKEMRIAASTYSIASRHIRLIRDSLQPLARKFGIPWPIDDKAIEILREAGDSQVVQKLFDD